MKLLTADWIVMAAISLYIATLCTTNYYMNYKENVAKQIKVEESVVHITEQNILYRYILSFENLRYIWSVIVLPSFLVSVYYYCRKKYALVNPELLEAIAVFFVVAYTYDFLNDISILLGILANG